jgi:predicted Zn-dependent protease
MPRPGPPGRPGLVRLAKRKETQVIASAPLAASERFVDLSLAVRAYVVTAKAAAADGLTWAEFGELLVGLLRLAVRLADLLDLPGAEKKTLVLEAAAARDLLGLLASGLDRREFDEGQNFLNSLVGKGEDPVGKSLFGDQATVFSDPLYAPAPSGTHASGLPVTRTTWIEKGVLKALPVGRFWAQKKGLAPQPSPGNLILPGEGK